MIESNKNSIIGRLNRGLISTKKQFNSTIDKMAEPNRWPCSAD
jgi:hypothetical protein